MLVGAGYFPVEIQTFVEQALPNHPSQTARGRNTESCVCFAAIQNRSGEGKSPVHKIYGADSKHFDVRDVELAFSNSRRYFAKPSGTNEVRKVQTTTKTGQRAPI
jgi:hypothetical protein